MTPPEDLEVEGDGFGGGGMTTFGFPDPPSTSESSDESGDAPGVETLSEDALESGEIDVVDDTPSDEDDSLQD